MSDGSTDEVLKLPTGIESFDVIAKGGIPKMRTAKSS